MPDEEDSQDAAVVSEAPDDPTELEQARRDQGMTGGRVVYVETVEL